MTSIEILTKISSLKVANMMRHEQFANVMDFMGLRGFKRMGEYHYFKENIDFRKLHRLAINNFNEMIYDTNIETIRLQPSSWQNHTRNEVDTTTRKKYAKQMFYDWQKWESETLSTLTSYYRQAEQFNCVLADYILDMMREVSKELKYLERSIIEYDATDWDMVYIMAKQNEMHDYYRCKTNELSI